MFRSGRDGRNGGAVYISGGGLCTISKVFLVLVFWSKLGTFFFLLIFNFWAFFALLGY